MKRFFTFIAVLFISANLFAQTDVTFNVNMNDSITSGYFVVGTDVVYMSGTAVGGWDEPGTNAANLMSDDDGDGIYTLTVTGVADGNYEYKYFKNSTWDNGEWDGGDNRALTVASEGTMTVDDIYGDDGTSGINDLQVSLINIFPNPSTGVFQLSEKANYEVMDIAGKVVLRANSNSINLTGFATGMYFVKLDTENGTSIQKIMVR